MKPAHLMIDGALAAVAGYVATKVMEPVSMKLYTLEPAAARNKEDAVRPGPPPRVAAHKLAEVLGLAISDEQLERARLGLHYGLALSWAPLYPLLRRRTRWSPLVAGLGTGAARSVIADELVTPAFGFSAPNLDYPLVTHARGFVAHLSSAWSSPPPSNLGGPSPAADPDNLRTPRGGSS
ncbi:MAG TPA: hypothetical protein VGR26_05710 [Acidimicrobiales bacterium]|nr:hypothetical protein [Acidimicrobiales bacterium]